MHNRTQFLHSSTGASVGQLFWKKGFFIKARSLVLILPFLKSKYSQSRNNPDRDLRVRILIVEDAFHVANLLAESVRLQGHEAIVARSGQQALSLLDQRCPDAVFLDIVMPEVSGIDVLRRIRETHPGLPVIVITGSASSQQIDEARSLGVDDVIEKPFALKQLDQALESLQAERP